MDTYHWSVLVTYQWNVVGCFIWDLFETSWRRADETSLLRPLETSLQRFNKTLGRRTTETSWRRSIETSLGASFGTYLRRRWDTQKDVITTSPGRLNAGWICSFVSFSIVLVAPFISKAKSWKDLASNIFHFVTSNYQYCGTRAVNFLMSIWICC